MATAFAGRVRSRREHAQGATTESDDTFPRHASSGKSTQRLKLEERDAATKSNVLDLVVTASTIGNDLINLVNSYVQIHPGIAHSISASSMLQDVLEDKFALEQAALSAARLGTGSL